MGRVKDGADRVDNAPKSGDALTSQVVVEIVCFCSHDVAMKRSEAWGNLP